MATGENLPAIVGGKSEGNFIAQLLPRARKWPKSRDSLKKSPARKSESPANDIRGLFGRDDRNLIINF